MTSFDAVVNKPQRADHTDHVNNICLLKISTYIVEVGMICR